MTEQGQGVAQPPYPREPNVHSGGKQEPGSDRETPPYSDRQTTGPGEDKEALLQERGGVPSHETGPRDISEAEREGMSDTEMEPSGPHRVGEVTTTSGEELSRGKSEDARRKDRLDSGLSDVGSKATPGSPVTSSGDQGG
jgi:hypothetical protein